MTDDDDLMTVPTDDEIEGMVRQYLITALWSSTDWSDESGGEPLDANYDVDDVAPEALAQAEADVRDFLALLRGEGIDWESEWEPDQFAHDFWLTRNGHGAGFWDRGKSLGDVLTKWAKSYGSCDPYVGDDGLVYLT